MTVSFIEQPCQFTLALVSAFHHALQFRLWGYLPFVWYDVAVEYILQCTPHISDLLSSHTTYHTLLQIAIAEEQSYQFRHN